LNSIGIDLYNKTALEHYNELTKAGYAKLHASSDAACKALSLPVAVIDAISYPFIDLIIAIDSLFRSVGSRSKASLSVARTWKSIEDIYVAMQILRFCFTSYGRFFVFTKIVYQTLQIACDPKAATSLSHIQGWDENDEERPLLGDFPGDMLDWLTCGLTNEQNLPSYCEVQKFIRGNYEANLAKSSLLSASKIALVDVFLQGVMSVCKAVYCPAMIVDRIALRPAICALESIIPVYNSSPQWMIDRQKKRDSEVAIAMSNLEVVALEMEVDEVAWDMLDKESAKVLETWEKFAKRYSTNIDQEIDQLDAFKYAKRTIGLAEEALCQFFLSRFLIKTSIEVSLNSARFMTGVRLVAGMFFLKVLFQTAAILLDPKKAKPIDL
jgi:hypothetical protein